MNCVVAEGTMEPVEIADWAAPIVPVLKPDKVNVRICEQTVNPVSKLEKYLTLKVEDLFSTLAGVRFLVRFTLAKHTNNSH